MATLIMFLVGSDWTSATVYSKSVWHSFKFCIASTTPDIFGVERFLYTSTGFVSVPFVHILVWKAVTGAANLQLDVEEEQCNSCSRFSPHNLHLLLKSDDYWMYCGTKWLDLTKHSFCINIFFMIMKEEV